MMTAPAPPSFETDPPTFGEMLRVFGRIGILSFGGPAAQIALMHRELVEERPWMSEAQFLNALSFCMLLPGPEAMQLATYSGWRMRGVAGGILAGLLFVLPGAAIVLALSALYAAYGRVPHFEAMFTGIKAAVVIIVIDALVRLSRKALGTPDRWVLAGLSFFAIFFLQLPFPAIILAAASYGFLTSRDPRPAALAPARARPLRTIAIWGALWAAPLVALWATAQTQLLEIGLFFSRLAVVTFGGAYAVLAYMVQEVVTDQGWITTAQMMDGLGLAETTPGPLILVTQFVGFLAGYGAGGAGMALAGAALTLWVTFVPCFLWIFLGAPYVEWIATRPRLRGALSAITAAVVGVILNLSLWFALNVYFKSLHTTELGAFRFLFPDLASLDAKVVALSILAAAMILYRRWPLPLSLLAMALLGLAAATI